MKKLSFAALSLSAAITFSLCGCSGNNASPVNEGYTFTDDLGRTVTVSSYEKTAPLPGSFADVWMLSGGKVCATANDAWEDFSLDLSEDTVNLGETKKLSLEALLSAQPDFVIASANTSQQLEWKDTLEGAGITVAYFDVSDFDDYLNMLNICTDITGNKDMYKKYGEEVKITVDKVLEKSKENIEKNGEIKVLSLRASAASIRAKNSKDNVLGEMLSSLGCTNIADSDEGLLENLNIEAIIKENPDKIFIVQSGDDPEGTKANIEAMFNENPAWYELDAVKNDEVYYLDKMLFNFKPNARWGEAYELLEKYLEE